MGASIVVILLLGLLQGLTEFLPVSSSGHVALLQHVWRLPENLRLPVAAILHVGTTAAVLVLFSRRLGEIIAGLFACAAERRAASWQVVKLVVLGSIPAAAVGLLVDEGIEAVFASPRVTSLMLLVTGCILLATRWARERDNAIGVRTALFVGLAQAAAILPGISRSGVTIGLALMLGLRREEAFEYSFLLAVPVTLGAAILELRRIDIAQMALIDVLLGAIVAFISGLGALFVLRRAVVRSQLYFFAVYCWLIGLAGLLFLN